MTDQEWEEWAKSIEARATIASRLAKALAGIVVVTALTLWGAYLQIREVVHANKDTIAEVSEKVDATNDHLIITDDRVDNTPGAPPPDPALTEALK